MASRELIKRFTRDRLSIAEVAKTQGVHSGTVARWILTGVRGRKLASIRIGGRRYVLADDLESFLNGGKNTTTVDSRSVDSNKIAQERLRSFGFTKRDE